MKKSTVVFLVFCATTIFFFIKALFVPALTPDQIYREPSTTPTINYYQEDLYAQCSGLKYFNNMINDNNSLLINENFLNEYRKTLYYIEVDKQMLGLDNFICP
jgi:hypothetical protein